MSDQWTSKEEQRAAESFNGRAGEQSSGNESGQTAEKLPPTPEEMQNAVLENLSDVDTIDGLAIAFARPAIKDAFAFLGLNHEEASQKLWDIGNRMARGEQFDPNFVAVEFPDFFRPLVKKCAETQLSRRDAEKRANTEQRFQFSELADILNGEDRGESSFVRSLRILAKLDTYRGPIGNEKAYTMAELRNAVVAVATEAEETAGVYVQVATIRAKLSAAVPSLSGNALDFYSSAIATHANLFHRRRVDRIGSNLR